MALASPGLVLLETLLAERARTPWLREIANISTRVTIWRSLRNLALGLTQLHEQHMLHRDISPRAVFVDAALGPESMRLGGFELTVRVGSFRDADGSARYVEPPEFHASALATHTFESDWYQFGSLIATVLVGSAAPADGESPQS